jgi:1-acyl-sn-glycerol-3-phosphate acyltransferase
MALFLAFAAVSLLCIFPLSLTVLHLGVGLSLLIALLGFLLLHVLYVLFFGLVSHAIPMDKPLEKQNPLCRFACYATASLLCFYGGIKPVVNGLEKLPRDGRFLFVSNHCSIFDPMIVMDRLRDFNISFISKPENMSIPIVGRTLYGAGFLAIDRENDRNALKSILTAADYLKRDLCSIGIYPEGTRSKNGALLPFHAGSFKIAQRAKVPVVVACMRGSEKAQVVNPFSSNRIWLEILDVIPAETVTSQRTDALAEQAREMIQDCLDRAGKEAV